MVDRIVRVSLIGDATSLIAAAGAARTALAGMANVNLGNITAGMSQAGGAAEEATKKTAGWQDALQKGLAIVGVQASVKGIVDAFKAVVGAGLEYQGNMNTLAAVTGASTAQMAQLGEKARQLGLDIKIPGANAADAALAMKDLAKGGLDVQQAMDAARGTLMLAAAAQVSAADAAEIQAKALNAFRLEADQAGHVADVLANAANAATGEVTDMAAGLQQSATVAAGFGISLDDTTTTLALFAKNGVIGSDAGTSFKTMLSQLASPTKIQKNAMDDLNLTIYDSKGQFLGMKLVTDQLSKAHQRMTTEQYNLAAATVFGTDAIRAANILGVEGVDGFNKMSAAVGKEGGAADLANAQTQGLNGALDRIKNVASTAALSLFENLQPAMIKITDIGTSLTAVVGDVVGAFFKLPTPVMATTLAIAAVVLLRVPLLALGEAMLLMATKAAFGAAQMVVAMRLSTIATAGFTAGLRAAIPTIGGMGLALKGLFLANPLGVVLVGLTTVLSFLTMGSKDAEAATVDLSDAIDASTGKFKANSDAILQNATGEAAAAYVAAGGKLGDYTLALDDNHEAQQRVTKELISNVAEALTASNIYGGALQLGTIAAGTSADQFAESVLNGTFALQGSSPAIDSAIGMYQLYKTSQDSLTGAINDGRDAAAERAAMDATLAGASQYATETSTEMQVAIDKVNKALGDSNAGIGFKRDIDANKHSMEAADLAAQGLTISLLSISGKELTAAQAARVNAASMRMIVTSARMHAAALDDITKKEQALEDLRANGSTTPKEIEKAQKAADKAQKAIADAEKAATKSQNTATTAAQDAQNALAKTQVDNTRSQADAQKALQAAQTADTRARADAQAALDQAQAASTRTQADAAAKLVTVQRESANTLRDAQAKVKTATPTTLGGAKKDQADAILKVAENLAAAQQAVTDANDASAAAITAAQQKITDANANGADSITQAQQQVADTAQKSAEQQAQAQQRVTDGVASSADAQEQAQQRVADANDSAAEAQQNAADVQAESVPDALDLSAAERAVADSKDAETAAANAQLEANDKAGQSARDMVAASYSLEIANGNLSGAVGAATTTMGVQRQAFIDAQLQINGGNLPAAEALADQQGLIAAPVTTYFTQVGIDGAIERAKQLNDELSTIDGKVVHYTAIGDQTFTNQQLLDVNAAALSHGYGQYNYGPGTVNARPGGPSNANVAELANHAAGGYITGPGSWTSDSISARLSNGEFVVNSAQTAKHRSLLENINNARGGYADGGLVGGVTPVAAAVSMSGAVAVPDVATYQATWDGVAAAVQNAWTAIIGPTLDLLSVATIKTGTDAVELQTLSIEPAWLGNSTAIATAWNTVIQPTYTALNEGTAEVGADTWALLNASVTPAWQGISDKVSSVWGNFQLSIFPQYSQGMVDLGTGSQALAVTTQVAWSTIGTAISTAYTTQIVPAWTGVQGFATATGAFFTGIQLGFATANVEITKDILAITTAIDEFFKMVDTKAPVVAVPGVTMPATSTTSGALAALADGGMITAGTGPRTDDVHVRVSKGEYIVNAQATAAHKSELDRMNYGGGYADGGMIGEKIGNRIENAIVGGTQRAVEAGITRVMASAAANPVPVAGADGSPVTLLTNEGTRGKFLAAVASQMGLPYVWGGDSPPEFDCSGLMSWALRAAGTGFGRFTAANFSDSYPNFQTGEKPGDMAIFDTGRVSPKAGHIGAVMDPAAGLMMHTDGAGPSRVSPYRGRSGLMGFIDPIGGAYVPATPNAAPATGTNVKPGDPPIDTSSPWLAHMLAKVKAGGTGVAAATGVSDPAILAQLAANGGQTRLLDTIHPMVNHGPVNMGHGNAAMVGPMPPGDAVNRWSPLYTGALQAMGQFTPANLAAMLHQMFTESSGNPLAIEETDVNFRGGHPSKGLLQTIPSTFEGHAPAGFNTNIWDPLSNALASIHYGVAQYGSLANAYQGHAYDNGGMLQRGWNFNGLASPEPVLTGRQWDIASSAMNHVIASTSGGAQTAQITVNARVFVGNREITDIARVEVDQSFVQLKTEINRQRGQAI